jgi:hypothetical protein
MTEKQFRNAGSVMYAAAILLFLSLQTYAALPNEWYLHQNFVEWHFNTVNNETYSSIRNSMNTMYSRGVRCIFFYCPFNGSPDNWLGCDPIDLMATYPPSGTVQDFTTMSGAAHDKGIAVMMYQTLLYMDFAGPFYQTAAANHNSTAGKCFQWNGSNPTLVWGFPGFNYATTETMDYIGGVQTFWCNNGVDGFEYDDTRGFLNATNARQKQVFSTVPNQLGSKLTIAEAVSGGSESDMWTRLGLSHCRFQDDVESGGIISDILTGSGTANTFESLLAGRRDYQVGHRGGSFQYLSDMDNDNQYACQAAAYAGAGVLVDYFYDIEDGGLASWSSTRKTKIAEIANAINGYSAQEPGGGRVRCSTGSDSKFYAVKRTSMDSTRTALNIYNFKNASATITVDLTGKGITIPQTPRDLITNANGPQITGTSYTVTLPAYGYLLLALNETATAAQGQEGPVASRMPGNSISLHNGSIEVTVPAGSRRIIADIYNAVGARISHQEQCFRSAGTARFDNLWEKPGFYYAVISVDGKKEVLRIQYPESRIQRRHIPQRTL